MRFAHLSDLHLGKRVCEFSMLEDQKYILEQILALLDAHPVDGVLLAGDLYDKPVPPAEAVRLLDWFLTQLAARGLPVFAISGNMIPPTVWPSARLCWKPAGYTSARCSPVRRSHLPCGRVWPGGCVLTALSEARFRAACLAGRAH